MPTTTTKSDVRKIPNLRFPGFGGEWEEKRLGDVFSKKQERNTDNKLNHVLTNSAVRGIVDQSDYFDKEIANQDNLTNYFVVDLDDFIYNPRISNSAPVGPLKRNTLIQGIMSPLYTVLTPKKGNLTFFEKYFDTAKWHGYMYKIANYGARHDRMNILQSDFLNMPLPFPEISEQKKIADFLSFADKWIETLKSQNEALESYKEVMLQIFFKNEQLIPVRFGDLAFLRKTKFVPANNAISYKCIELEHIEQGTGKLLTYVDSKTQKSIKNMFKRDDVLFGKLRPYLRKFWKAEFEGVCSGEIWVIQAKANVITSGYLFYLIQTKIFMETANISSGSKMPRADWNLVANSSIPITTDLLEQKKIADFLTSIDKLIESKQQQVTLAEQWKKGLMQNLFV